MNVQRCCSPLVVCAHGSDDPFVATCATCSPGIAFPVRLSGGSEAKGAQSRAVCLASANISSLRDRRSGSVVGDPDRVYHRRSALQRRGRRGLWRADPNALGEAVEPSRKSPCGNIWAGREVRQRETPLTAQAERQMQTCEVEARQGARHLGALGQNLTPARPWLRWAAARRIGRNVPSRPAGRAGA
jgi:hypothetical protein